MKQDVYIGNKTIDISGDRKPIYSVVLELAPCYNEEYHIKGIEGIQVTISSTDPQVILDINYHRKLVFELSYAE